MSRFLKGNANVEMRGITFAQIYKNARDRFEYYGGDPDAAAQNFCCEIEKMMGVFPNTSPPQEQEAAPKGEAVAWTYEMATALDTTGEYCAWSRPQLSFDHPAVPEGSVRNVHPLVYGDMAPPSPKAEPEQEAVEVEREACAQIADDPTHVTGEAISRAIRARGHRAPETPV